MIRRAIVLGGGGPVCGLQIGALRALAEHDLFDTFSVWSLSCIGAWVGIIVNQYDGKPIDRVRRTYELMRDQVFVPDEEHAAFPTNRLFAMDMRGNALNMLEFVSDLRTWQSLWVPGAMLGAARDTIGLLLNSDRHTEGDLNMLLLRWMSAHPLTRLATSAVYRTQAHGISRMHYPDSSFLRSLRFGRLMENDRPIIYHNAYNLTRGALEHFSNRAGDLPVMDATTLCACSALPLVLKTVEMGGDTYCEGAMIRPLDFDPLDRHEVDEVWSLPILDHRQVKPPRDLTAAMGNLPMLPAAAHGRSLAEAYRRDHPKVRYVEIAPSTQVTYEWSRSNLEACCRAGYDAAQMTIAQYLAGLTSAKTQETW